MVYNFDEITKETADVYRGGKPMASCDALYQKDAEHIYLIAFYPELSLTELCQRLFLIVVYNEEGAEQKEEESEYFQAIKKKVGGWAGNRARILFGLEIYKGLRLCMPCVGAGAGAAGKGTGASAPAYDFPLWLCGQCGSCSDLSKLQLCFCLYSRGGICFTFLNALEK